jgi:hypothetical protein
MEKDLVLGDVLTDLFFELNQQNINYVVLRNYELLPHDVGHDLDVLIKESESEKVDQILKKVLLRYNLYIKRDHIRFSYRGIYIGSNENSGFDLQIDFYTSLVKGWITYSDSSIVLANRIKHKTFYIPEPSHELQAIIYKELFAYKKVRVKYDDQINLLKPKISESAFFKVSRNYISKFSTNEVYEILLKGKNFEGISLKPHLGNVFHIKNMLLWGKFRLKEKLGC